MLEIYRKKQNTVIYVPKVFFLFYDDSELLKYVTDLKLHFEKQVTCNRKQNYTFIEVFFLYLKILIKLRKNVIKSLKI